MKKAISLLIVVSLIFILTLPAGAKTSTYTYTDRAGGNSFQVPTGWNLESLDNDFLDVKFVPSSAASALILYGSTDLWSSLSAGSRKGLTRSDVDNAAFSRISVANFIGAKSSDVKMVTLGGNEYFRGEAQKTRTAAGLTFNITLTNFIRFENGWMYWYQFGGGESHSLYDDFEAMVASASYTASQSSGSTSNQMDAQVYTDAISAYNSGSYNKARDLFESISGYEDSESYLRLIRIRNAGSNIGLGGKVYNSLCGLTASDKKDIDAAAKDFDFADTAEVLLSNSDVACYFLCGRWESAAKGSNLCYWELMENQKGGYNYYISSKLSTNYADTFSIIDGKVYVDILGSNKLTMTITLTSPDCMEVHTNEKNRDYTLYRK